MRPLIKMETLIIKHKNSLIEKNVSYNNCDISGGSTTVLFMKKRGII